MASVKLTDEDLIRQFQQGDGKAFDELVERYSKPLYNFIYRILRDPAFSEDLLQETFLRLYLNKDSYREIARFSTWIYTIASNLAKTELRRQKVRRWMSLSGNVDNRPIEIPDDSSNPLDNLQRNSILCRVEAEIQKLPSAFREVIVLRDIQELSYDEISSILKIPLGTVKSRVNRGRIRLQKKLVDLK